MITMIDLIKDSKELGLKDWAEESQDQLVGVDSLTVLKLKYQWDHHNNYSAFHLNIYLFFSFFPKTICGGGIFMFFSAFIKQTSDLYVAGSWLQKLQ